MTNKKPKAIAGTRRLARRRDERIAREVKSKREPYNIYLLPPRIKPAPGAFGPPPAEIGDVGGYDLNGNPL